jgi:hypothetical protein
LVKHIHILGTNGASTLIMNKNELIEIIQRVLNTNRDLSFLQKLQKSELETLVACIRDQVESRGNK